MVLTESNASLLRVLEQQHKLLELVFAGDLESYTGDQINLLSAVQSRIKEVLAKRDRLNWGHLTRFVHLTAKCLEGFDNNELSENLANGSHRKCFDMLMPSKLRVLC